MSETREELEFRKQSLIAANESMIDFKDTEPFASNIDNIQEELDNIQDELDNLND